MTSSKSRGKTVTGRRSDPLDATTDHTSDSHDSRPSVAETVACTESPGEMIGRYRIKRLLGEGAFGSVWLGFDEALQLGVAIKVPKAERFRGIFGSLRSFQLKDSRGPRNPGHLRSSKAAVLEIFAS